MQVRAAVVGDESEVARVHVRSWQKAYRGLLADEYLQSLDPADRAARYSFGAVGPSRPRTIVAVQDGRIRGLATFGPSRDVDEPASGELYALYVDPDSWGIGMGRILINEAQTELEECGFTEALLWVMDGNVRAERFYALDGWKPDGSRRREHLHGVDVDERRFVRSLR